MTEAGGGERFEDLVPRWMFIVQGTVARVALAVGVTLLAGLPLALTDPDDQLRVGPLLGVGVVVVAALGGWWAAGLAGMLSIGLFWLYGLPPSGSADLDGITSWLSLFGMCLLAIGVPLLTRRVERAVDDVRELDEQRQVAVMEQAALRHHAEDASRQVQGVLRMAAVVAGEHRMTAVADAVLDGLDLPARPTTASVAIVEDNHLRILSSRGGAPEHLASLEKVDLRSSPWLDDVLHGEPSFVDDRDDFAAAHPHEGVLALYRTGSWAVVPFRAEGAVGLLSLHHATPQPLTSCSSYFTLVAEVLAAGLERAHAEELQELQLAELQQSLAERDRIARTLSTTLLPPALPRLDGLALSAWLVPASLDEVAGDFYDVFSPSTGGWVAVLGDVCGKGAEAAAVTSLARYAARVASLDEPDPAHVAAVANQALLEDRSDLFCTMAIVRGTHDEAHLDVTLAGHLQPRVLGRDGVARIGAFGTALGLASDEPAQTQVPFAVGDVLVMFSDGLVERCQSYGEDELDADLASWRGLSAEAIAGALRDRVDGLDADRADDVAVLVIRRVA